MPNQDPTQNQTDPNQSIPQGATPPPFFPQEDIPPMPPAFQNISENQTVDQNPTEAQTPVSQTVEAPLTQEPNTNTGSAAPNDIDISSVIKAPKKKFGTGKIIATILGLFLLVGGVGAGIVLTQQQQLFQQKAASCAGRCDYNCTEGETGQGKGTGGCPSDKYNCVPNVCIGVPDAGTSCVNAGFVCVAKGTCPAGHNQAGSCNTANTDCCDTASSTTAPGATAGCVFDHYSKKQVCVQVSGTWQRCDTVPVGEMGVAHDCTNDNTGGADSSCNGTGYPNCVPGPHCIDPSQSCVPSVLQYANCKTDSSCTATNPPDNPTPTPIPVAPYCTAVKAYDSEWTLLTNTDLSKLTTGSVVNFCVNGSAPSGTFDKAQFTINGTQLAETTVLRTGSTDYCQSYTILSTDTTVSVTAKIHHLTLGWF